MMRADGHARRRSFARALAICGIVSTATLGHKARMLVIDDLSVRVAGSLLIDAASARIPAGARVGLVGRNGAGKTTLFRVICGEVAPEHGELSLPSRTRIGRLAQEAPDGPQSLLDIVLAADAERARLLAEAETERDPHRIAEIQTRLADIGAHSAPARAAEILAGLGFSHAEQAAPLRRILRRLAHAGGACRGAVRRARPAPARRAHQLSRPRGGALAGRAHRALSAYGDRHQPRSRSARHRGRLDPASRAREARALPRRLYRVRAPAPRAPGARSQARQEAGSAAAAADGLRRSLSRQGHQGAPGAVAPEAAGQARADRGGHRRGGTADRDPAAGKAAVAADHRARRRCGRLRAGSAGAAAALAAHRRRRPHRAARRQRQRQIDAGQARRRKARADVGPADAGAKARRRLFRPAPARRAQSA